MADRIDELLCDLIKNPLMAGPKTYCQFVGIPPITLRTLLKEVDGAERATVGPMFHGGKDGSVISTEDEELFVRIQDRFATKSGGED